VPSMSQAQSFYERYSFYEVVTEWIGHCLRRRYRVPKELPPKLLALVRKLDAIESKPPRTHTPISILDAIEGNYLLPT
jgi:hypothetical protein